MSFAVHFNDAESMERRIVALDQRGPQARLRDHGGGDDEPRGRAPRARLPRGGPRDHAPPRHRPDLRRGQDRPVHRRRAARSSASASSPTWSRWPRRWAAACRPARSAGPRRSWRSSRTAASTRWAPTTATRSAWRRRARACTRSSRPRPTRTSTASTTASSRAAPTVIEQARPAGLRGRRRLEGLRHVLADEDRRLRDVQGQPGRRARRPRLAVQHEPRDLHDAGPRGGVDALGDPHRRGGRPLRRRVRGDGRAS